MANVATKVKQAAAKTVEEHDVLLARIRLEHEEATEALAAIEVERRGLLLDGGDAKAFYQKAHEAEQHVRTLTAALEEEQRRRDVAYAAQQEADKEEAARQVRDEMAPALEAAVRDFYASGRKTAEAAARMNQLRADIRFTEEYLRSVGRGDLTIGEASVIERVSAEIAGPQDLTPPERMGKGADPEFEAGRALATGTDDFSRARYEAWEKKFGRTNWADHESDESYRLRCMNHFTMAQQTARRDDPITTVAEQLLGEVSVMLRADNPVDAAKGERRVKVYSFKNKETGGAIQQVTPVDGIGNPGRWVNAAPRDLVSNA